MSATFFLENNELTVRNHRFNNLIEWAVEAAEAFPNPDQEKIEKMKELLQVVFSPRGALHFEQHFNQEEMVFWAKAFLQVAHDVFDRKLGKQDTIAWQPSAIADAVTISRMLQNYCGKLLKVTAPIDDF